MAEIKFLSNWEGVESVPKSYVLPPEKRPCIAVKKTNIPVVDFATNDRALLFQKILDVTQEFGIFQVINHGVSKQLIEETMKTLKEFHFMSPQDKMSECSKDPNKSCKVHTGSDTDEQTQFWRDSLSFNCHPLEKYIHFWPEKPPKFREVVGAYSVAMRKFVLELVDLISEGLKIGRGNLGDEMSSNPTLSLYYYPPCPNPSLTLGLRQHCDGSLITVLFQDVNGLQILKDGEWIAADPIDDALLINFGYVFEVISNGKLKAAEHRVVTNTKVPRQSLIYLACPENNVIIEPAKCLINETNPPHYRSIKFEDFERKYTSVLANKEDIMKFMSLNKP